MTADLRALLDRLDTALAAATPGPWSVPYPFTKLVDVPGREASITSENASDAALIVAAVNALPDLLAAVRAAADLADELEVPVEGLTGPDGPMVPFYNGRDVAFRIRRTLAAALPADTEATR